MEQNDKKVIENIKKKEYTFEDFEKMKCSECINVEGGGEYLYVSRCRTCQHFRRGCTYIH